MFFTCWAGSTVFVLVCLLLCVFFLTCSSVFDVPLFLKVPSSCVPQWMTEKIVLTVKAFSLGWGAFLAGRVFFSFLNLGVE